MKKLIMGIGLFMIASGGTISIHLLLSNPDETQMRLLLNHPLEYIIVIALVVAGAAVFNIGLEIE